MCVHLCVCVCERERERERERDRETVWERESVFLSVDERERQKGREIGSERGRHWLASNIEPWCLPGAGWHS